MRVTPEERRLRELERRLDNIEVALGGVDGRKDTADRAAAIRRAARRKARRAEASA